MPQAPEDGGKKKTKAVGRQDTQAASKARPELILSSIHAAQAGQTQEIVRSAADMPRRRKKSRVLSGRCRRAAGSDPLEINIKTQADDLRLRKA